MIVQSSFTEMTPSQMEQMLGEFSQISRDSNEGEKSDITLEEAVSLNKIRKSYNFLPLIF